MNEDEKRLLNEKAESGDYDAARTLGNYYRQLEQTKENDILSHYYYNIAAELGYAPAKFMVALDYMGGNGVKADMTLAVKYMQEAADEGVAKVQYMYALFCSGDGNKLNGKAISYFEKAAKQGLAKAQVALGDIYMFERKEIDNAIFWWVCAYMHGESASNDSNEAMNRLNELIQSGVQGGRERVDQMIEKISENKYIQYRQEPN